MRNRRIFLGASILLSACTLQRVENPASESEARLAAITAQLPQLAEERDSLLRALAAERLRTPQQEVATQLLYAIGSEYHVLVPASKTEAFLERAQARLAHANACTDFYARAVSSQGPTPLDRSQHAACAQLPYKSSVRSEDLLAFPKK